jgi:O-antigen/teichoic acid export membrane protein
MAVLSYAPAYLIPLIASLFGIFAVTRILTPAEYGLYALAISLMALCQSALFSWLDLGAKRFYERARSASQVPALAGTLYVGLALSAVVLLVGVAIAAGFVPLGEGLGSLLAIAAAVTVAREFSLICKTFQLTALARTRYSLMECSESVVGLAVGLALCWYAGLGATGILLGMLVGAGVVIVFSLREVIAHLRGGAVSLSLQREIIAFAAPVSAAFFVEYIVASADRLLVARFLGTAELGIYAVSYSIAERAVSAVFLALGVASYPLVMRAFEREGAAGARRQAGDNAELLLALALPAWGGFTIASAHVARVFLGPAFAPRATGLMPLIAAAVFLYAFRLHYVTQSMHLARRTWAILAVSIPAAIVNLGLNCVLLPRMGLIGAAWASLIAYAFALAISIWQANSCFPLPFPLREGGKALLATGAMCVLLRALDFPQSWEGLAGLVLTGSAFYGLLTMVFDIGRLRSRMLAVAASRKPRPLSVVI